MSVLGELSAQQFLRDYWQSTPLLVRGALAQPTQVIDAASIIDLACEPEVEARLVVAQSGGDDWQCEYGPFEPSRFTALTGAWTVLVQNVDAWSEQVASLLDAYTFLPRWRLDDVMVSLASDGGGVGPHFDWYDVFLIQTGGRRRWQVGPRCDAGTVLREHPDLRLLPKFEPVAEYLLEPGDLLYLPAGVAHRGTALGAGCITCSVGFRAPSTAEIMAGLAEQLATTLPEDLRYRDPPAGIDEDPYRINDAAIDQVMRALSGISAERLRDAACEAFGTMVTAVNGPPEPNDDAQATVAAAAVSGEAIELAHGAGSRFAYRIVADGARLYVDGDSHLVSAEFARGICHGRLPAGLPAKPREQELLHALLEAGSIEISS